MLLALRLRTWSFIRAMRGEITMQIPSVIRAGTWKQTLLPPPVGSMASVSRPSRTEFMISSCRDLKLSYPQYRLRHSAGVAGKDWLFSFTNIKDTKILR